MATQLRVYPLERMVCVLLLEQRVWMSLLRTSLSFLLLEKTEVCHYTMRSAKTTAFRGKRSAEVRPARVQRVSSFFLGMLLNLYPGSHTFYRPTKKEERLAEKRTNCILSRKWVSSGQAGVYPGGSRGAASGMSYPRRTAFGTQGHRCNLEKCQDRRRRGEGNQNPALSRCPILLSRL